MDSNSLQTKIMRRVYYSYALSFFTQAIFWQGVFLGVATVLLARWLHVASIINNFLSVPVREVPNYLYSSFFGAISHGEFMTAFILVLAGLIAISAGHKLMQEVSLRSLGVSRA